MPERIHLLHLTPTFTTAGAQMRTAQIVNHLGNGFRHTIVSQAREFGAAEHIAGSIEVECLHKPNDRNSVRMVRELSGLIRQRRPQLIFTYNWGSMDAVLAALISGVAPIIHFEDGFGADEALRQKRRRVWYRWLVLRRVHAVVAPSANLVRIMRDVWKLRRDKIRYIPNGVDPNLFVPMASANRDEIVIGTVGHLRREKRQEGLIQACAALRSPKVRLLLAGDGPERARLEEVARGANPSTQVEFLGHVADPRQVYRRLDMFALSSSTEQMPVSVLEAMACGLPVLSTDVGDVRSMVSPRNRPFIVSDPNAYQAALSRLAEDAGLRQRLGADNRARCVQTYALGHMLRQYELLCQEALASSPRRTATNPDSSPPGKKEFHAI